MELEPPEVDDDLAFRARMTQVQFAALAIRCSGESALNELVQIPFFQRFKGSATTDLSEVRKWIINGWNTECLLRINLRALTGDALRNSLQWAFPQAYYSVFTIATAFFKVAGYTESSHTSVIRKFGAEAKLGKYPRTISFLADGGKTRIYQNIARVNLTSSLEFDRDDSSIVDTQICQFLNATRKRDLVEKKIQMPFRTKQGTVKERLTPLEWDRVSSTLGPTSILSLLYRKRIKSNYRDIDTFLSEDLMAGALYDDLIQVVSCLNLVHEAFVARAVGLNHYTMFAEALSSNDHDFVRERQLRIARLSF